eukprot:327843-Pelagomonas_calceolata.AAC.1
MLRVPDWKTWDYTDESCQIQNGKQEIRAGVYCPLTDSTKFVEPNGAKITSTICRAGLTAIAAATTHSYSHIASQSLASLHQIRKEVIFPEKHKQHIQGDVLKIISILVSNSKTNICVYKVKSHAGIAGNECADAIANYQASQANNNVANTGIPSTGPGGNPFSHLFWSAKEERNAMLAHPQLLHPILKSPTTPIFKVLSSLILCFVCIVCIQNADLYMPTPKHATTHTIRACYLMLTRKSAMPSET